MTVKIKRKSRERSVATFRLALRWMRG